MSFTIAEVAELTGLTAHTLRYYERDGLLLGPVERAASGHRRYTERDLTWITLITRLRATGMPIRDVKRYAALVRAGAGNEQERLDLLLAHRSRVEAQLAEITGHLRAVDHKIGIYEGKVEQALDFKRARTR
ncbi:MerR family transcriptional regulator [Nocardioides phosphati]|uniref:MerR family transcriptional regulator n=1 Tax=Nocardioides phosphati TaxID=1867775 RepID=A0ABQ2NBX2_9ACTN|nr:MerR family transcriptional regulator [Nocardioides phosphati]GGO92076.1 MerR family transcriptional regulator [Nocardioides phosphati]